MNFPNINFNINPQNLSLPSSDQLLEPKSLVIAATSILALCILHKTMTSKESRFRPLVETGKIAAAGAQGVLDGTYHGITCIIEGVYSGIFGASIALTLEVGKDTSYISPENISNLESNIFAENPWALNMAKTHINPLIQKYLNTSCLDWLLVGLIKGPIVHSLLHPPKHAIQNGALRATQIENAACYLGLVDRKKQEDTKSTKIYENTAFATACVVSATISILTGALAYKTTKAPDFPSNVGRFLNELNEKFSPHV